MTRRQTHRQHWFRFSAHLTEAHLPWTDPMNAFEVTVEVADCGIATIGGNGLDRRGGISEQLRSPRHPHLKQVSAHGLPYFSSEKAANPSLSEAQQPADLVPGQLKSAPTLVDHSQENSDACVHDCASIIAPGTWPK